MRIQDIVVGNTYRLKSSPDYGYVKVTNIYKQGQYGNPHPEKKSCIECEHTVQQNDRVGFIRLFRPMDLIDTGLNNDKDIKIFNFFDYSNV